MDVDPVYLNQPVNPSHNHLWPNLTRQIAATNFIIHPIKNIRTYFVKLETIFETETYYREQEMSNKVKIYVV